MKIACVGGGPGGLYFAVLMKLRHPQYDVTVFERNRAGSTYGFGLVYWDDLREQLRANDPISADAIERVTLNWTSQVVEVPRGRIVDPETSGYSIHRRALLDVLEQRASELGVQIEYSHEVPSRAEIQDADVIVASDGVNSRLRDAAADRFGTEIVVGRNKYVWLGTDKVFETFDFYFVPTDSGWVWGAAYGIDGHTSTFIVECSPETWSGLGFDTLSTEESLASLEKMFASYLDGQHILGQLREQGSIPWLNFRRVTNEHWHDGNVVLLGDAAHTTHFSIGSGTRLALEDAIALADNIDKFDELEPALEAYEMERKAAIARPQAEARYSLRWLEHVPRYIGLTPQQFFELWELRRSPMLANMDPRLYYWLHWATEKVPVVRDARNAMGLWARTLHGRKIEMSKRGAASRAADPGRAKSRRKVSAE